MVSTITLLKKKKFSKGLFFFKILKIFQRIFYIKKKKEYFSFFSKMIFFY